MIFLDSWVWLELFFQGEHAADAAAAIREIDDEGGVIAPTVLLEVNYRARRREGADRATHLTRRIWGIEGLSLSPIDSSVALRASEIRDKYYHREDWPLSYADAIHITTAEREGCTRLYSGDPDFEGIDEVETVSLR